ncbi:MAG: cytochrome c [Bacteroidetes bacterium]|nr:cytochrome c [Bacteroidota bacterium]
MIKKIVLLVCLASASVILYSFQQKPKFNLKESIERGKDIYIANCLTCHIDQGEGIEDLYPPLAKSDYLMADKKRSIQQVLYGAKGEMKVNGKTYNTEMVGIELTDQQTSDVLNYIRNSFGNKGGAITPEEVNASRKK